jgi:hypothetical protein
MKPPRKKARVTSKQARLCDDSTDHEETDRDSCAEGNDSAVPVVASSTFGQINNYKQYEYSIINLIFVIFYI